MAGKDARKALAAWAEQVRAATRHLNGVKLAKADEDAVRAVHRIAYAVLADVNGLSDGIIDRQRRRIVAAGVPRIGEGVAVAHRLIQMHAERSAPLTERMSDAELAVMLCSALASNVHEAFKRLKPEAVEPLLARYTRTKDRTRSKITAAGILVDLNRAARWPLGKQLKAGGVSNAVRRNLV